MLETLHIFSAGAAQAVVARLVQTFQREHACAIQASYGAVQSMRARVVQGEPADIVLLTDTLIDELVAQGLVVPGSRVDLGTVGTGIAVRANTPLPSVDSLLTLRDTFMASDRVVCPDPAAATAGKVLLNALEQLGIREQMQARLTYCSSGYEAMAQLARGTGAHELGIMQMTEIIASSDVALAGPLPGELQSTAIYSAGVAAQSASPALARQFIRQLTDARADLLAAGFGACAAPLFTTQLATQRENAPYGH